jgi:hypothetical protein
LPSFKNNLLDNIWNKNNIFITVTSEVHDDQYI